MADIRLEISMNEYDRYILCIVEIVSLRLFLFYLNFSQFSLDQFDRAKFIICKIVPAFLPLLLNVNFYSFF